MVMDSMKFGELVEKLLSDMNKLCDDLYAATEDKPPQEELAALIELGKRKIADYENLLEQVTGGKREQVMSYSSFIDEVRKYTKQLEKG